MMNEKYGTKQIDSARTWDGCGPFCRGEDIGHTLYFGYAVTPSSLARWGGEGGGCRIWVLLNFFAWNGAYRSTWYMVHVIRDWDR